MLVIKLSAALKTRFSLLNDLKDEDEDLNHFQQMSFVIVIQFQT